jgi:hypothetical protein
MFFVGLAIFFAGSASAQEFNCKVSIVHAEIRNVDPQVFTTMEQSVAEFVNNRKWTNTAFRAEEKIDMNILLQLSERVGEDGYKGRITINATRPVFNTSYASPTVNFVDRDLTFRSSQYTPLTFDDNRVAGPDALASNLTAVLAYYCYIVLGLDYDSFEPNAGDAFFKKAQNVVSNAPEGSGIGGWRAVESRTNRYWIIDQILNPRFVTFRTYWYQMHRKGLDNLYSKPDSARQAVLGGVPLLSQLQRENPGSILLQFFFNAKSDEIVKMLAALPREERAPYIAALSVIDVTNIRKYDALK